MVLLSQGVDRDVEDAPPKRSRALRTLPPRGVRSVGRRWALLRRALLRSPLVCDVGDRRYEARRAHHAPALPRVSDHHRTLLNELGDAGVAVRSAHLPPDVVGSAKHFVDLLRSKDVHEPCAKATPRELARDPRLFAWGLSEHLLDLAECHIGLPARYLGVEVKRETVDTAEGRPHEVVRRWHLDHEDRRIFKVIIYLSDVHSGAGPFGYIHLSNSATVRASAKGFDFRGVPDDRMLAVVPRNEWEQVTGPRMTAIYVDTGQVFHRVFPPRDTERYSVTFAYSSRTPFYTYSRLMLPRESLHQLRERLSPRQWEALCVGRDRRG